MLSVANTVYDVEKATEASLTFLIQMTVLTSGIIPEDGKIELDLLTGRSLSLDHREYMLCFISTYILCILRTVR